MKYKGQKIVAYFTHEAGAIRDPKIIRMMVKWKCEGYGLYWAIVEAMREQTGYKIKIDDYTYEWLSHICFCSIETIKEFVDDCVNIYKLFILKNEYLFSERLLRDMEEMERVSNAKRNNRLGKTKKEQIDENDITNKEQKNNKQITKKIHKI